jgi:hypothetical protein
MPFPTILDYLPEAVPSLVKTANLEEKLPWYGVTAGGVGGAALGGALSPKHKLLGQLAGSLAGTAVGLEGGAAVGRKLDHKPKLKVAALPEPPPDSGEAPDTGDNELPKSPILHGLGTLVLPTLGFGAGMAAGHGVGKLVRHVTGDKVSPPWVRAATLAAPLVGSGAGLAYGIQKEKELEELRRAVQSYRNQSERRDPAA